MFCIKKVNRIIVDLCLVCVQIVVYSSDDNSYQGEVIAYDYHYNICVIGFQSHTSLSVARVAHIDDSIDVKLNLLSRQHSKSYNLVPGDGVIVVGRYFHEPYDLMAAPGPYRLVTSYSKTILDLLSKA